MKRTYHGCEIESKPESKPVKGSDGWSHIVRHNGSPIGEANALGEAIQIAKNHKPEAKPVVKTEAKPVPKEKASK